MIDFVSLGLSCNWLH